MHSKNTTVTAILITALTILPIKIFASELDIPNSFQAGNAAVAAEVNDNFTAVKNAVDDNNDRIATLEATITSLETLVNNQAALITALQNSLTNLETSDSTQNTTISNLESSIDTSTSDITQLESDIVNIQNSEVLALEDYLTVDTTSSQFGPNIILSGINLHINNGLGDTFSDPDNGQNPNGLGNIIIGYDESGGLSKDSICSYGIYVTEPTCTNNGFVWSDDQKSGSHYLVLGEHNNYTQSGGIISGRNNTSNNVGASVTSGAYNISAGEHSATLAGARNVLSGENSAAIAGFRNNVQGLSAASVGGADNVVVGDDSVVLGGQVNISSGDYSTITGGRENTTAGTNASVVGGMLNSADGLNSVVLGGSGNTANVQDSIVPTP